MKLKEKVRILEMNDVVRVVSGKTFTVEGIKLDFIVHESRDGWREGLPDISEKSSGKRLSSDLKTPIHEVTLEELINEVKKVVKVRTKTALMKNILVCRNIEEMEIGKQK